MLLRVEPDIFNTTVASFPVSAPHVMLPSLSPHRLPLSSWVAKHGRAHPSGRLFWGGLKAFADGSLGSRTALFWAPYDDAAVAGVAAAHASGQRAVPLEQLREMVKGAVVNGLQVGAMTS